MSHLGSELLQHILAEADYLSKSAAGLSRESFLEDETLRRAFVVLSGAPGSTPDSTFFGRLCELCHPASSRNVSFSNP